MNELLRNLDRVHTTQLGIGRIKKNLSLEQVDDVVSWCRDRISDPASKITRKGKNFYVQTEHGIITVNANSYTIITAHQHNRRNA